MFPQSPPTKILCLSCIFIFFSCVKDVDVDQFHEIVVPPSVAVDLVYFTLDSEDLLEASGTRIVASDKTRLDFLDDNYIQESLVEAKFNFVYTNSFEQDLVSTITFLNSNGSAEYSLDIFIPAGSKANSRVVDHTEIISEDDIAAIRKSLQIQVEVQMLSGLPPEAGQLNLESRGFYKFEFQ